MGLKSKQYRYTLTGKRGFFSSGSVILGGILLFILLSGTAFILVRRSFTPVPSISVLYRQWQQSDYSVVHDTAAQILAARPLDGTSLALHGFSAYYLFVEETDPAQAQLYLVTAINSLRNALYRVSSEDKTAIAYVLGKAYYHRGYYYADLSLKYLDIARSNGFSAGDLEEFRGLAAASLGDYELSNQAFTAALAGNPSDILLHAIADNYYKLGDTDRAKQYLFEAIAISVNEVLQLKCRTLLGTILFAEGRLDDAMGEFTTILQKDPNSADAHYGLGVIYETQGDMIRARAEWRRAIRLDPVHPGARSKLNL